MLNSQLKKFNLVSINIYFSHRLVASGNHLLPRIEGAVRFS